MTLKPWDVLGFKTTCNDYGVKKTQICHIYLLHNLIN